MAATTTSTTGDQPPPPQTTATTTTPKPPALVIPSPLIRPTPTITPQFLHHHRHHHHRNNHPYQVFRPQNHTLPQLSKPFDTTRYPLASSGRGLIPTNYRPTTAGGGRIRPEPVPVPAFSQMPGSGDRVNSRTHGFLHYRPLLKVGSSPYSVPDSHFPKDLRDKKPDDPLVTLRDRKVRLSDGASVYALCRSWLRNGYPEEIQPQYGGVLMSLPKPLPPLESSSPKRKERDDETEVDEVDINEITSAEELLTRLIKRAKRVRARLRKERSQRIERYESRLTLLLPPNGTVQE